MLKKIVRFYTQYFVIFVVMFGLIAYISPSPFIALKPLMGSFFALTMFGIGIVLDSKDFTAIIRNPLPVFIGSVAQFTIMPFGAWLVAQVFGLPPAIALGLILTGSAPGAMASNVMCYVAGADTAYSVSLTTVSTLLTPLLTPGLTYLLARSYFHVNFFAMFLSVLRMVILPLLTGLTLRYFLKSRIDKIIDIFPAISVTFIIFICSLVIALNRSYLAMITGIVLLAVIVLNVQGMAAGYGVGKLFRFDVRRRRTLSIEIGMQNAGLGTVLALKHFGEQSAIPTAAFVFICIISASIMSELWRRSTLRNNANPL